MGDALKRRAALSDLVARLESVRRDAALVEQRIAPLALAARNRDLTDDERALKDEWHRTVRNLRAELRALEARVALALASGPIDPAAATPPPTNLDRRSH